MYTLVTGKRIFNNQESDMINRIIAFSINNKLIIGLLTLALIAGGIWSISKVPLDAVPDITNNQVLVIAQAPNLSTQDIEQFITYPIELGMSNLPGVTEIRSTSRFGLSIVTIVFEDDMGTYLPRQLVSEKLIGIKSEIPASFSVPYIGPISTGLGEIYQYALEVAPAYKEKYDATELRTIQDWIIKRQMAMVPGVVEVNAYGGNIKQYEVAINPNRLKALNITITDIYNALEANNQNVGGGYIEKDFRANFIRGDGLLRSVDDINNIVITTQNGIPITIRDAATVKMGSALRYGAFTKGGQGEAVGGMILMLKGANSNDVITAVKNRIEEIQKSLPEGITIKPFLDRSKLIANTTSTVSTNLMEGALIVIFVLVILLGNWRGGLIVSSTIPLSLLFAFILMHIFGVWANLMSLGAIDFGIIVDGAVIIVESVVFLFYKELKKGTVLDKEKREKGVFTASSKMMNSAFFGQLIILIVFIPILALEGVEGKMFKPMALTFMFAMIGVMVLCLTYVPVVASLFIKNGEKSAIKWGESLVKKLENLYQPLLEKALKNGKIVLGGALISFIIALFVFTRLGGEFIPKLDEGDIAFHIITKPGTGLNETIRNTTLVENLILENFPDEVEEVMSRIGVADVPTDPMPMDIADGFIILKDKSHWRPGLTKQALIEEFKHKVEEIPGLNYEFTQPIEMRFNELIAGVREDIAVKLFGDDLEILAQKAEEMGQLISSIDGVGDLKVEATDGLPQINIKYKRPKIAQYGLTIDNLNQTLEIAFSGGKTGVIFEGEKRFDLVVRMEEQHRKSVEDLRNLYVTLPNGLQIPLSEVAEISYLNGPMQISRENTNRRTYVGINVRGRDIKSLVEEIQQKLDAELELPPGYFIRYGGAFENLERATDRLKIVVPIALALIFLLIFMALKSIKHTFMIYIAIPLASIGGVFSLWIRDMPFSISAGVGFIVLFGVAVLNGLVLISSWKDLKATSDKPLLEQIIYGARHRIRPILLTALTDILGFLPMAISTTAGAEVQKPLATVVIGGMISASLLTLFVLPVLYKWLEEREQKGQIKNSGIQPAVLLTFLLFALPLMAQNQNQNKMVISDLERVKQLVAENNNAITLAKWEKKKAEANKSAAFNPGLLNIDADYGPYASLEDDISFSIVQEFAFPTLYINRWQQSRDLLEAQEMQLKNVKKDVIKESEIAWWYLGYLQQKRVVLKQQDTLYARWETAAKLAYETEEKTLLEYVSAQSKKLEIEQSLEKLEMEILNQQESLNLLVNTEQKLRFKVKHFTKIAETHLQNSFEPKMHPSVLFWALKKEAADQGTDVAVAKMLPKIRVGFFSQTRIGSTLKNGNPATKSDYFTGFKAGVSIPLFFTGAVAEYSKSVAEYNMAESNYHYYIRAFNNRYEQSKRAQKTRYNQVMRYEQTALKQADLLQQKAQLAYRNGALGYVEFVQNMEQSLKIKLDYLAAIFMYRQSVADINYFKTN